LHDTRASGMLSPLRDTMSAWARFDPAGAARRPWMRLAGTAIFSAAIAFCFTLLGFITRARTLDDCLSPRTWLPPSGAALVISLVIGYLIHGMFTLARRIVGAERVAALTGWQHALFFITPVLLAVATGWPIGAALLGDLGVLERLSAVDVVGSFAMS